MGSGWFLDHVGSGWKPKKGTTLLTAFSTSPSNARVYNWTTLPGFGVINASTIFPGGGNPIVNGFGLEFNGFTGGGSETTINFNNVDSSLINQTAVPTIGPSAQTGALSLITRGGGNIS